MGYGARHVSVNNTINIAFTETGVVFVLERLTLARDDKNGVDAVIVLRVERCLPVAWDVIITNMCIISNLQVIAILTGAGAAAAEVR